MNISELITTLEKIKEKYGDIEVVGGYLHDDTPLQKVFVIDDEGHEIWPDNPNGVTPAEMGGLFLEG